MSHWANRYIGKEWEAGATGPDAYDCFSLFRHIQQEHYGISVPIVDVDAHKILDVMRAFNEYAAYTDWLEVSTPTDGDAVVMSHSRHPSHIGVWIDTPGQSGVLHCVYGLGVVFSSLSSLNAAGWGQKTYWRHIWPV